MKKPTPEDFGMTSAEYRETVTAIDQQAQTERERRRKICRRWETILMLLAWPLGGGVAIYLSTEGHGDAGVLLLLATLVGSIYISVVLPQFYTSRESSSIARMPAKIRPYEVAVERYQVRQERYWLTLRGTAFEKKLASLYRKLGYVVRETKGSGDEGVDLYLSKDGMTLIVQCKGHKKPIGVATARDLYGTFVHCKVDAAVLACPAGFTDGVRAFAEGKPIALISAKELAAMVERTWPRPF